MSQTWKTKMVHLYTLVACVQNRGLLNVFVSGSGQGSQGTQTTGPLVFVSGGGVSRQSRGSNRYPNITGAYIQQSGPTKYPEKKKHEPPYRC